MRVPDYRAYVIGNDGHVLKRHDFECLDDLAALEYARQYVVGKDVEVWQLDRVVGTLHTAERDRSLGS